MAKLKIADYMKVNPAMGRISEMLENAFNGVGEKIRQDLLDGYRGHAKQAYEHFIQEIKTRTGPIKKDSYGRQEIRGWHEYADFKKTSKEAYSFREWQTWEDLKAVVDRFSLSYREADKNANYAYENARDSFVHKNLDKLAEVMGKRSNLKNAVLRFDWRNGCFEGNVQVYLQGAYFRGEVSIKYVIRRIPRVTPYFQYPLVFTEAEVGGRNYPRPSEVELRNLLSGKSSEQHEKEKAAQASAEGLCPMSGKPAEGVKVRYGSTAYETCPLCKTLATVMNYKWRKHKTAQAQKSEADKKLTDAGYCPMSGQRAPYHLISNLLKPHTIFPGGKELIEYDFSLFDSMGKYRKVKCEVCGQDVTINDSRGALKPEDVRVIYRKHKLVK